MNDALNTLEVAFRHDILNAVKYQGQVYVSMRRIVENLGMAWGTQQQKLMRNQDKFGCIHMNMVAADGKIRRTLCIPLRKLNGWLFSINPSRIRADLREKVATYQEECFHVLYEHFIPAEGNHADAGVRGCDEESAYYLTIASEHFAEILDVWCHKIEPALMRLESPLVKRLHDRFSETSALLAKADRRLRGKTPEIKGKPWS